MTPHPTALDANLDLLRRGVALLEALPDEVYCATPGGHSSVGAQYRHILDHYACFLDGLGSGVVDYDARRRDPLVETSTAAAIGRTRALAEHLERLAAGADPDAPLDVTLAASTHAPRAAPRPSSVGRELLFLASHTVHHYAILRLLLEAYGVACDAELGVAPSTLAHRATTG